MKRLILALLVLVVPASEAHAKYPADIEKARLQCRFNAIDRAPLLSACQKAAIYFTFKGPPGYSRLYTDRVCKLASRRDCRRFRRNIGAVRQVRQACDGGDVAKCDRMGRLYVSLWTAEVRAAQPAPQVSRPSRAQPARPSRAQPARHASALRRQGRRATVQCMFGGAGRGCVASVFHHVYLQSPKRTLQGSVDRLCKASPGMVCERVQALVPELQRRLSQCRAGSRLACQLSQLAFQQRGLTEHAAVLRRLQCGTAQGCVRSEATWSPRLEARYRFHREACRQGYTPSCREAAGIDALERSTAGAW